jgi:hypothetical protein
MTHKVGWDVSIDRLARLGPDRRDAISSGVKELLEFGYLERAMDRTQGRFKNVIYRLADPWSPAEVGIAAGGNPAHGEPGTKNNIHKNTINKELNPHRDAEGRSTPAQRQMLWDNHAAEFGVQPTELDLKRWHNLTAGEASAEIRSTKDAFFFEKYHGTLDAGVPGVSDSYLRAAGVERP